MVVHGDHDPLCTCTLDSSLQKTERDCSRDSRGAVSGAPTRAPSVPNFCLPSDQILRHLARLAGEEAAWLRQSTFEAKSQKKL